MQKSKLLIFTKNGFKYIVDLNFVNHIEGKLPDIKLSIYSPTDAKMELTLKTAKAISIEFELPFISQYMKND